jgi:transcriptional regulator with XRE-family HTH domain
MGTSQSTIARLENGQTLPSTKTILRYAKATGSRVRVRLSAAWRISEDARMNAATSGAFAIQFPAYRWVHAGYRCCVFDHRPVAPKN